MKDKWIKFENSNHQIRKRSILRNTVVFTFMIPPQTLDLTDVHKKKIE